MNNDTGGYYKWARNSLLAQAKKDYDRNIPPRFEIEPGIMDAILKYADGSQMEMYLCIDPILLSKDNLLAVSEYARPFITAVAAVGCGAAAAGASVGSVGGIPAAPAATVVGGTLCYATANTAIDNFQEALRGEQPGVAEKTMKSLEYLNEAAITEMLGPIGAKFVSKILALAKASKDAVKRKITKAPKPVANDALGYILPPHVIASMEELNEKTRAAYLPDERDTLGRMFAWLNPKHFIKQRILPSLSSEAILRIKDRALEYIKERENVENQEAEDNGTIGLEKNGEADNSSTDFKNTGAVFSTENSDKYQFPDFSESARWLQNTERYVLNTKPLYPPVSGISNVYNSYTGNTGGFPAINATIHINGAASPFDTANAVSREMETVYSKIYRDMKGAFR